MKPKKAERRKAEGPTGPPVAAHSLSNGNPKGDPHESEAKRLKSVKQMIKAHQEQKSAIKAALSNVDFKPKNKIVFGDSDNDAVEDLPVSSSAKSGTARAPAAKEGGFDIFGSGDDDDDLGAEDLEIPDQTGFETAKSKELWELQKRLKKGGKFQLGKRFLSNGQNEHEAEMAGAEPDDDSLEAEKRKELAILGEVLNIKLMPRVARHKGERKGPHRMVVYDPSQAGHEQYELKSAQSEGGTEGDGKKSRKEAKRAEAAEANKPEVSKETFYKVSDELKLQEGTGFSFLSTFGTANEEEKAQESSAKVKKKRAEDGKKKTGSSNPFKFDSSDDEEVETEENKETEEAKSKEVTKGEETTTSTGLHSARFWSDPFFFREDDYRFQEGLDFLKRMGAEEKTEFVKLRRDFKGILKAKFRNNQRKVKAFKKKLGGNRRKKNIKMKKAMKR